MFRERYTPREDVNIVFRTAPDPLRKPATDARKLRGVAMIATR